MAKAKKKTPYLDYLISKPSGHKLPANVNFNVTIDDTGNIALNLCIRAKDTKTLTGSMDVAMVIGQIAKEGENVPSIGKIGG